MFGRLQVDKTHLFSFTFLLFLCQQLFHGNMPAIHCGNMAGPSFRTLSVPLTCWRYDRWRAVSLSEPDLATPEGLHMNVNSTKYAGEAGK